MQDSKNEANLYDTYARACVSCTRPDKRHRLRYALIPTRHSYSIMSVPSAIHVAQEPKNMSSSKKNPPPFNSAPARSQATQHQQSPIRLQSRSNTQSPQQNHQSQPICPWSAHTPPFGGWPSPFLRSSHVLSTAPTTPGKLFSFGGYVHSSGHASNDLYVISTQDFSANLLQTSGDVPDPRYAHGAVFTGTTLVVWGGMLRKHQCNDNSLYLLNIGTSDLLMSRPIPAD